MKERKAQRVAEARIAYLMSYETPEDFLGNETLWMEAQNG